MHEKGVVHATGKSNHLMSRNVHANSNIHQKKERKRKRDTYACLDLHRQVHGMILYVYTSARASCKPKKLNLHMVIVVTQCSQIYDVLCKNTTIIFKLNHCFEIVIFDIFNLSEPTVDPVLHHPVEGPSLVLPCCLPNSFLSTCSISFVSQPG